MAKKYSMFPSGVIVDVTDGIPKKASKQEQIQHLASMLPGTYKGEKVEQVSYDPKTGCVYGKTASKTIKKTIFAQQVTDQAEPVDGSQKEVKVPQNESKAKPETSKITKDRPDVAKPEKVRDKEYQRGTGGENLHTNVVPRDGSGDGVGGKKVKFDKENADKATSGNPDSYVQEFTDSEKGSPAGSEKNHTAGTEIEIKSDQTMYQDLKLSSKDEDDEKEDKKEKKLPSWLKKGDDDEDEKEEKKEDKEASAKIDELKKKLAAAEKEITGLKLTAGRTKEATVYALSLLRLNASKYSNPDTFTNFIETTANNMSMQAIKTATDETRTLLAEKQRLDDSVIKEASVTGQNSSDGGVVTMLNTVDPEDTRFEKTASKDDLKNILMSGTKLGRDVASWADYTPSQPR